MRSGGTRAGWPRVQTCAELSEALGRGRNADRQRLWSCRDCRWATFQGAVRSVGKCSQTLKLQAFLQLLEFRISNTPGAARSVGEWAECRQQREPGGALSG